MEDKKPWPESANGVLVDESCNKLRCPKDNEPCAIYEGVEVRTGLFSVLRKLMRIAICRKCGTWAEIHLDYIMWA